MHFLGDEKGLLVPFAALLVFVLASNTASAQTGLVTNPTTLVFTASANHSTVLASGQPMLDHYSFDIYAIGAAQPFQQANIGKPAPAADGTITYNFSGAVASWPLPGGNYEARVAAVGPAGSSSSSVSNTFTFTGVACGLSLSGTSATVPAAGGGSQFTVTTASGCSWTAAAGVSWIAVTPASGTGTGTVVLTIAANASSVARTGSVSVGGQVFTVNQLGDQSGVPTSSVPSPWLAQDIGSVGLAGSASYSSGTFTVVGSGADIWGTTDAFRFIFQPLNGDGQVVARVRSQTNTNYYAKAGIMLRAGLTASAAHVMLDVMPNGTIEFMTRTAAGASTTTVANSTQAAPVWLRLARSGTTVTASVSADGVTWRSVGSTTTVLGASVSAGLVVTSHDTTLRNTATFDSASVGASTASSVPAPWANADVGSVGLTGSTTCSAGTFTVVGSGADIWGTTDGFHFAYQPLNGDGQVVARVLSQTNTNYYAKAGLMLRAGLTASAPHVMLDVMPNGTIEFMTRTATGASTTTVANSSQAVPVWLRLARSGTTITASVSADGATWRSVGSTTTALGTSVSAGLVVTSHDTTLRNTATFDNVSLAGLPSPWVNQDVGSVGLAGSATYASGTFIVAGAGADIWGTADAFQFVRQPSAGDGRIVVRMTGETNTNYYAKAGVMYRAGLGANAAFVMLDVMPNGSVEFIARSAAGAAAVYLGGSTQPAPAWLRLARTGTTVTASVSADGATWTTVGSTAISLGTGASVGLVVTSHDTTARNTARFDNVSVQ